MPAIDASQLALFLAEAVLVAALLLTAFRLRHRLGLSMLCVVVGALQPIQVVASTSIYAEVVPGLPMSPGSVVLFVGSLFAVLLVYLREDAVETRKIVYGLLAANLGVTALYLLLGRHLGLATTHDLGLPPEVIVQEARVMVSGTLVLVLDVLLLLTGYTLVGRVVRRPFLRIYLTMALVLLVDSVLFATGAFLGRTDFEVILVAGAVGKLAAAVPYTALVALYLRHVEPVRPEHDVAAPLRDVFHALSYRERYEEEVRASGERLRTARATTEAILRSTTDGLVAVDRRGSVLELNPAAERMLGVDREAVLGRPFLALLDQDPGGRIASVLREGRREELQEVCGRRADGGSVPLELSAGPGRIAGQDAMVVSLRDISERRRLQAELVQAQKLETVGRLAGNVAHDFNNLLTVILARCQFLLRELADLPQARDELAEIELAAQRAAELTSRLLSFARKRDLAPRVVDANRVVEGVRALLGRLLNDGIELHVELAAEPLPVKVDPILLEQVLVNLVVNARDAMPDGGHLTVSTTLDGRDVLLLVRDTGVGMSDDVRHHLFEPFFTTKAEHGTGLGLAICYSMVHQAGGTIRVDSEEGRGTTFLVRLPRAGEQAVEPVAPAEPEPIGGSETVLVVDDEPGVLQVTAAILRSLGYEVLTASDPEDALARAERHGGPIDLLVTDAVMPRMGGVELARRLRRRLPDLHVLLISGFRLDVAPEQADAFVEKPFAPRTLARRVRDVLEPAGR